jgi:hypothetical protein
LGKAPKRLPDYRLQDGFHDPTLRGLGAAERLQPARGPCRLARRHGAAQRALVAPHEQTLRSGPVYFEEIQLLKFIPVSSRRCRVSSAIRRSLPKTSLVFVRKSTIA